MNEKAWDPITKAWYWKPLGPGRAATGHHRGELVVGMSEQERNRQDQKKHRAKQAES